MIAWCSEHLKRGFRKPFPAPTLELYFIELSEAMNTSLRIRIGIRRARAGTVNKCYVGIQPNYEAVEVPLTSFTEREENLDEESNDSIIEVDKEQCKLCGEIYEDRSEVIIHIAKTHFKQGLLTQLLSEGWKVGDETCPACDEKPGVEMVLHWAKDHGKVQEMLDKCQYGGEVRLAEDRKVVNAYLERNNKVKVFKKEATGGQMKKFNTFKSEAGEKVFEKIKLISEHNNKEHSFKCSYCETIFNVKELMETHEKEVHKTCVDCEDEFTWTEDDHTCYYTKNNIGPATDRVQVQNLYFDEYTCYYI